VRDGRSALAGVNDPEGFAATCHEFDQDITASREPRLALALASDSIVAIAADGRSGDDVGLSLWELADLLVDLGAHSASNVPRVITRLREGRSRVRRAAVDRVDALETVPTDAGGIWNPGE